eukprot:4636919-Heterocapsa_arctica.AAC.1
MSHPRKYAAAGVISNRLYIVGGRCAGRPAMSCGERFDPGTGMWTALPPMSSGRFQAAAATVKGKLYVIGGW